MRDRWKRSVLVIARDSGEVTTILFADITVGRIDRKQSSMNQIAPTKSREAAVVGAIRMS